jgi:predicted amidohydrolase YtcJ
MPRPSEPTSRPARRRALARLAPALAAFGILALALPAVTPAARAQPPVPAPVRTTAELIVTNARIHTADAARPLAQALAVRDGRLVFVGDSAGAFALRGPATRVVDLAGRTVIPGMVDAHGHLLGLGLGLRNVDLVGTTQLRRRDRARRRARPADAEGHVGRRPRVGSERLGGHALPHARRALARLPRPPVYLERVDGHAALVNTAAMRAAGIGRHEGPGRRPASSAPRAASRPACWSTARRGWPTA